MLTLESASTGSSNNITIVTTSTPHSMNNDSDDYRRSFGLPPRAFLNESEACHRPYPDQKQCLPYFMGLSCDLCGASALASLLARHPSLAWGVRQEHDFFTRSEFSAVRMPKPPAHDGTGGVQDNHCRLDHLIVAVGVFLCFIEL